MKDGPVYPVDCNGPVFCAGRYKRDKTFVDDILFPVYPEIHFAPEVVRVIRVGTDIGYSFIEFMAVLFYCSRFSFGRCPVLSGASPLCRKMSATMVRCLLHPAIR
jgi:hypothetical protein